MCLSATCELYIFIDTETKCVEREKKRHEYKIKITAVVLKHSCEVTEVTIRK